MKTHSSILVSIAIATILSACISQPTVAQKKTSTEPEWLNDPYFANDDVAAVGCARAHYDGVPGQKKLAVANAIDEIASQVNTTVKNVTLRRKNYNEGRMLTSQQDTTSLHSVQKTTLQTKIKAYHVKNNGDICAWVTQK